MHKHLLLGSALLAGTASAQSVEHYWDFTSTTDLVGGVPTIMVGTPDLSVNTTYGEAYAGAGNSLNSVTGGTSANGGYLEAAVFSTGLGAMDWGMDSYSFSYWIWDDLAVDGDVRGPRVFDNLDGTTEGIQLGTNAGGFWNLRNDEDTGGAHIFDQSVQYLPPADRWIHIVGVTDRAAGEVRMYEDGVLVASAPLADSGTGTPFSGNIFATQDLQIGVINGGTNGGQSQACGIDDLAFYRGVLTAADAMALTTGAVTPLSFRAIGTSYCGPAPANSTGVSGRMSVTGSDAVADNDVTLAAADLPLNAFGFFLTSTTQGLVMNPGGSQGNLCLGGSIGRYVGPGQILNSTSAGRFALAIDLTQHPTPMGLVSVTAGQSWNFQAWYRDAVMGNATSNFTDGVAVTFQ